jgi:hypothetical protein
MVDFTGIPGALHGGELRQAAGERPSARTRLSLQTFLTATAGSAILAAFVVSICLQHG